MMFNRLRIFQIITLLCIVPIYLETAIANNTTYIVYSAEEMQEHKQRCKEKIRSSTHSQDPSYQMHRALCTIASSDTDYIPKVEGAGEIFYDETTPYQRMHNGLKVVLHCYYDAPWTTDVIYGLKGHHEPAEEKCFYEVLKYVPENATMIELGSYWAYYSLWFASQIKGAKNYLIEPDPHRLEVGRKNFQLNNLSGFFKRGFVGRVSDPEPDISGTELISMDDFIEKEGIQHINILHSDIQGAEAQMLETTVKYLDKIDYFFISTHGPLNHFPCIEFFNKHKFTILAEHLSTENGVNDGLIVAKRPGVSGPEKISIQP